MRAKILSIKQQQFETFIQICLSSEAAYNFMKALSHLSQAGELPQKLFFDDLRRCHFLKPSEIDVLERLVNEGLIDILIMLVDDRRRQQVQREIKAMLE